MKMVNTPADLSELHELSPFVFFEEQRELGFLPVGLLIDDGGSGILNIAGSSPRDRTCSGVGTQQGGSAGIIVLVSQQGFFRNSRELF